MINSTSRVATLGAVTLAAVLTAGVGHTTDQPAKAKAEPKIPSVLTVTAATTQTEIWPAVVSGSGALAAWQEVIVSPETGGLRIADLLVDVGAHVSRGQLLARLADDSLQVDLRKQQAAVAQARAMLEQAVSNLHRTEIVANAGALSAQKIEDYRITEETSRASLASAQSDLDSIQLKLRQTRIVAADDGIVSSRSALIGNVVSAGTEMFRLVRQGRVEWRPEFDARQVAVLNVGQQARLTLPGGEQVVGRVRMVGPTLNTNTGRAMVYVSLPVGSPARVGMFANGVVEFVSRPAQTLPQTAVTLRDGRAYVYLLGSGDKVSSHTVTTGRRQGERVEVEGIPPGARVVTEGGAFLSEGAQVTVVSAERTTGNVEVAPH